MNSQERAAARPGAADLGADWESAGDGQPGGATGRDGEWVDMVAGIEEALIELPDETTEKEALPVVNPPDRDRPAVPVPAPQAVTGEVHARSRRSTLVSPIPAMLAESMGTVPDVTPRGREAVPQLSTREITRPVTQSAVTAEISVSFDEAGVPVIASQDVSSGYTVVEVVDETTLDAREVTAELIERARTCFARGDLSRAVLAVDEVLSSVEKHSRAGIADLVQAARPMFDRIFAAYLGLLSEVPVMARSDEDVAALPLDGRTRALLAHIDGVRTLEQIFGASKVPAVDAVRIAATLMCAGIIRVV